MNNNIIIHLVLKRHFLAVFFFCALFKMQSFFLLKRLLSFRSAHVTWTAGLPCTGQLTRYQPTNCSRTEIQHILSRPYCLSKFYPSRASFIDIFWWQGNLKCVKLLLAKGANWKGKDSKGRQVMSSCFWETAHQPFP